MSRQSCLTANDKGGNEIILGAVHRSPGTYLTTEETPKKSDRSLCDQSSIQMRSPLLSDCAISIIVNTEQTQEHIFYFYLTLIVHVLPA